MIKQKFIINIQEHEFELSKEEAEELYKELKPIFETIPIINPNIPNNINNNDNIDITKSAPIKKNIPPQMYNSEKPDWANSDVIKQRLKEIGR